MSKLQRPPSISRLEWAAEGWWEAWLVAFPIVVVVMLWWHSDLAMVASVVIVGVASCPFFRWLDTKAHIAADRHKRRVGLR